MSMKKSIHIEFQSFQSIKEVSDIWFDLFIKAQNATENSFSPYSEFRVGCCLLLENGCTIHGYNQENVAFPSGLCAERVALFKYGTEHTSPITHMAITAKSLNHITSHPITSCGGCLQVMIEFEKRQKSNIAVLFAGETGEVLIFESISKLIPFAFSDPDFER